MECCLFINLDLAVILVFLFVVFSFPVNLDADDTIKVDSVTEALLQDECTNNCDCISNVDDDGNQAGKCHEAHGSESCEQLCMAKNSVINEKYTKKLEYVFFGLLFLSLTSAVFIIILRQQMRLRTADLTKKEKELVRAHEQLKLYSVELEEKVQERTELLKSKNQQLESSVNELKRTQSQLILSEKMAALGNLIAGVAHEINSPLSAIHSSSELICKNISNLTKNIKCFNKWLSSQNGTLVEELLSSAVKADTGFQTHSTREERIAKSILAGKLEEYHISDYDIKADFLLSLGLQNEWERFLPLLKDNTSIEIIRPLSKVQELIQCTGMIDTAVSKASKTVRALKHYMHISPSDNDSFASLDVRDGLDTVLVLFHNKIKHGVKLEKNYRSVPEIMGNYDELNQVWTNLIQNALHAMDDKGELIIDVFAQDRNLMVKITDNGTGIPEAILDRVFEPMFTTKKPGEGTGLGMDIVKRIVEKHKGSIELDSQEGKGTTVIVYLPLTDS